MYNNIELPDIEPKPSWVTEYEKFLSAHSNYDAARLMEVFVFLQSGLPVDWIPEDDVPTENIGILRSYIMAMNEQKREDAYNKIKDYLIYDKDKLTEIIAVFVDKSDEKISSKILHAFNAKNIRSIHSIALGSNHVDLPEFIIHEEEEHKIQECYRLWIMDYKSSIVKWHTCCDRVPKIDDIVDDVTEASLSQIRLFREENISLDPVVMKKLSITGYIFFSREVIRAIIAYAHIANIHGNLERYIHFVKTISPDNDIRCGLDNISPLTILLEYAAENTLYPKYSEFFTRYGKYLMKLDTEHFLIIMGGIEDKLHVGDLGLLFSRSKYYIGDIGVDNIRLIKNTLRDYGYTLALKYCFAINTTETGDNMLTLRSKFSRFRLRFHKKTNPVERERKSKNA